MIKKLISYTLFIGFLYLFLFNPPYSVFRGLFGIGNFIVLASIIFAFAKPKVVKHFLHYFKKEYSILVILLVYVVLRTVIGGGDKAYIARHFLGFCDLFLVTPMILFFAKKIGIATEEQAVRAILLVSSFAAIISFLCLINPSLNDYVKNSLLQLSADDYIMVNDYRGFGYASLLTSDYGFLLGLVAGYGSLYLKNNKLFILCIPLLLFATIINARTGVVLAMAIIAVSTLAKRDFRYIFVIGALAIVLISYYDVFFEMIGVDARTSEWSMSVFKEVQDVSQGNIQESYAANELFNNMIVFPPSFLEWIVGRGYSIVKGGSAGYSDVGWILQLNYGGIIYISILYSFFFVMLRRLSAKRIRTTFWVVLVYILLINTKSSIFPGYSSFYLLFMFYAMKLLPEYRENTTLINTNKFAKLTPTV